MDAPAQRANDTKSNVSGLPPVMTNRRAGCGTTGGGSGGTYHRHEVLSTMKPPSKGPISGPMNGDAVYIIIGADSSWINVSSMLV